MSERGAGVREAGTHDKDQIAAELELVRARSLRLCDELSEENQQRQHSPLMSPLVWDLAHVGNYEELWLQRALGGPPAIDETLDDLYDAFRNPRQDRPALQLHGPAEAREYISRVRATVLDVLDGVEVGPGDDPLLSDGFVYGMVVQHEHQHDETMLATRQLMGERATPPAGTVAAPRPADPLEPGEVRVDGGTFVMGTSAEPWAYDNERPAHEVTLDPFWIDVAPVTNGQYLEFMADGGYDERRWWSDDGWAWRSENRPEAPLFWEGTGEGWTVLRYGARQALDAAEPVQHVCWYEADAFARWAGRRLPTEAEWEMAASWDPAGSKRRYPWGQEAGDGAPANLGQRHAGPVAVGAHPEGVSPWGCHQMIGDVWEWTASDFRPYPGFEAFPYSEYSEVFWGPDYKVLRGGSWATHPLAVRTTFRNWDHPIRRQIFAGFRCARDE